MSFDREKCVASLKIKHISESDTGAYHLFVENVVGVDQGQFNLTLTQEPSQTPEPAVLSPVRVMSPDATQG